MKLKSYLRLMRFHKPVGIVLFVWPALWALWISGSGNPHIKNVIIFVLGTIVMRAAGCVINDIADRKFDKFVKRTAMRPLTTGEISLREAIILFFVLLMIAAILAFQLNVFAIELAMITLAFSCLYPFTKRWISCPQLFLGLAVATSVPMAFAVELNHLTWVCGVIYCSALLWPIMYDTQYAMVDREDDLKIGIKSTAILFGKYDVLVIAFLQGMISVLWLVLGYMIKAKIIYYIFALLAMSLFFYQMNLMSKREPEQCFKAFLNNQWVGGVIFLGLLFHYI